jgi:hypothetical protein
MLKSKFQKLYSWRDHSSVLRPEFTSEITDLRFNFNNPHELRTRLESLDDDVGGVSLEDLPDMDSE